MGNSQNISAWWKNFTVVIHDINKPLVAWKTIAKEVYQLTAEIPGVPATETEPEIPATPATYRLNVYPIDRNDLGADLPDVQVGYKLMDFVGQVYDIIAVNETFTTIEVADILLCGYCPQSGRPAMIYKDSDAGSIPPPPTIETRWVVVSATCLLDESLNNTGQQEVVSKKQRLSGTEWIDTGEITTDIITNTADCPPPAPDPYGAWQYVGLAWSAVSSQEIIFTVGVTKTVNTMIVSGNNYLFLSIPTALSFTVTDGSGVEITDFFVDITTPDERVGYQPNKVWRKNPKYSSGAALKIFLTIS